MIDPDAELRLRCSDGDALCERASAAGETRVVLREDIGRLQAELLIASSIAAELVFTLPASDPERA